MTPMEMSGVIITPVPKIPSVAHSSTLKPPPKALEEDDDSDENEFDDGTTSESGNDGESEDYQTDTVDQTAEKSSASSSHSR